MKVTQSCLTVCNPWDYTVHGITPTKRDNLNGEVYLLLKGNLHIIKIASFLKILSSVQPNRVSVTLLRNLKGGPMARQCREKDSIPDEGTRSHTQQLRIFLL